MKKQNMIKTIQLIIYSIFAIIFISTLLTNDDIGTLLAANPAIKTICILVWVLLGISFLFIFIDFSILSAYKKDYSSLEEAVHTDSVSGIANRFSCDAIISKYADQPLPVQIGCIMFDLSNISEINRTFSHNDGNQLIRDFSQILKITSAGVCFVGRNGGNKFLAVFEDCSTEKIDNYLERIQIKVIEHNNAPSAHPIVYQYGVAFNESKDVRTITDLIALSNNRIYDK